MVADRKKDGAKTPIRQGPQDVTPEPNKIDASTPYDFNGKNLTPWGGLLPVINMLGNLARSPRTTSSNEPPPGAVLPGRPAGLA